MKGFLFRHGDEMNDLVMRGLKAIYEAIRYHTNLHE